MKTVLSVAGLIAAAAALPTVASAQQIGVVDVENVVQTCNACVPATQALQTEANAIAQRQQQLTGPLQTQGQAIQAEYQALNGAQPSAELQQRAQAFEQQRANAAREIQQRQTALQRNQNYVLSQIGQALQPAYAQVLSRRNLSVIIPETGTLAVAPSVNVTSDVLAELNRTLTSIQTTAPAAPQQPQPQQTPATGR